MSKEPFRFSDNIRVKAGRRQGKDGYTGDEYLHIWFHEREEGDDREVILSRYCVPGRCDSYAFSEAYVVHGRPIVFSADYGTLADGIKLVQEDLNKPQVVKLLVAAVSNRAHRSYSRTLINRILASIAPKSRAYKACVKAFAKLEEQSKKEWEALKAKRLLEARELVATADAKV